MGYTYGVICNECDEHFDVNEGSGMVAMPLHCDSCGREWWWEFGPSGPLDEQPDAPPCPCGGRFTADAPPRCPRCRSRDLRRNPDGLEILYD